MFAKLVLIILCAGAIACCLLAIRQERIEAAHQMWQIHHRLVDHQNMLWDLRRQIFSGSRPEQVRRMIADVGGRWTAIPAAFDRSAPSGHASQPRLNQVAAAHRRDEHAAHRGG